MNMLNWFISRCSGSSNRILSCVVTPSKFITLLLCFVLFVILINLFILIPVKMASHFKSMELSNLYFWEAWSGWTSGLSDED